MPFLRATNAFVCAYDISADACKALELQAATAGAGSQRLLITADLGAVRAAGPYDLVVALFGVLSHIEGKENRIDILCSIRSVLSREGLLLLTVPTRFAAFPCMHHRMVAAAKAAVRFRLGRRRAVTSPRHDRLSIAITSTMRRGRFLTTCSHAVS
jgi:hypothetical protein